MKRKPKRRKPPGPRTPQGKKRAALNSVTHGGYRYLLGGLLPTCQGCVLKNDCPEFDLKARTCGLFGKIQEERMAAILQLPHIREEDVLLVTAYVRNVTFLDVIDFWISKVGPFIAKQGMEVEPVLKTRWTVDNAASRQAAELGLTPASRKALGLGKRTPPRDITQLSEHLLRRRKERADG